MNNSYRKKQKPKSNTNILILIIISKLEGLDPRFYLIHVQSIETKLT